MPRHVRIGLPEAVYHVMSYGNRQDDIDTDTHHRERFLRILAEDSKGSVLRNPPSTFERRNNRGLIPIRARSPSTGE